MTCEFSRKHGGSTRRLHFRLQTTLGMQDLRRNLLYVWLAFIVLDGLVIVLWIRRYDHLEDRIRATRAEQWPTVKKQVKSFHGIFCFHVRFILNLAANASPLADLGKPNTTKDWQDCHKKAFQILKNRRTSSPIICLPSVQWQSSIYSGNWCIGHGQ